MDTYNEDQLHLFHERIGLAAKHRRTNISALSAQERLDHIGRLMRHTLNTIPFENLSLHYSTVKGVSIDPDALYAKCLASVSTSPPAGNGRGGYCMENNQLFGTVLRTLGYDVFSVCARVYNAGALEGFGHHINLITIGQNVYSVDVGFGGNGPLTPLRLPVEEVMQNAATGEPLATDPGANVRLVWDDPHEVDKARLAQDHERVNTPKPSDQIGTTCLSLLPQRNCWIYQWRRQDDPGAEWTPIYAFTTQYASANDYKVMNLYTSTSPTVFFTQKVTCVRMLAAHELAAGFGPVRPALEEHISGSKQESEIGRALQAHKSTTNVEDVEIVGQVILFGGSLKIRVGNQNVTVVEDLKSEDERIEALNKYFSIILQAHEKRAIEGMVSAIS